MFRSVLSRLRLTAYHARARGLRFSDLLLGALARPGLAWKTYRKLAQRRVRRLESGLKLAEVQSRPAAAPDPRTPVTRKALIQGLGAQFGVIVLAEDQGSASIGLSDVNFLAALAWLDENAPRPRWSVDGTSYAFEDDAFLSEALASRGVELQWTRPGGRRESLFLEPYARQAPGHWVSPNTANVSARSLYDDRLESPGVTQVSDLLGAPSFDQWANDRPVDVVFTWVNHADPDWAAMYARYKTAYLNGEDLDELGVAPGAPAPGSADALALSRFHSNDELRYSLRSVAQNLPWVRQIHVFTNCAPPDWLKTDHPGINWVQHDQVIPPRFLPTFSSHVIESFLHHIPGLADRFLYMNDDVFIGMPLPKSYFFGENGATSSFLEPYGMVAGERRDGDPDYLNAARNSAGLIREAFGFAPTRLHRHVVFALRRDVLVEMEARWPDQFEALRHNRFRTAGDLNIPSFLYHYYGFATGRAAPATTKSLLVKSNDLRWREKINSMKKNQPEILCINEGGDEPPERGWHRTVREVMQSNWPRPAPWER